METLAYSHLSLAHEEAEYLEPDAYELKLFKGLNWTPPSSAWIGLIASLMTLVSLASNVQAAYVRTNGSPLNLRASPAGAIVGSLRNGSYVSVAGNSSGSWTQLTNPRGWVSSRWISGDGGGSGGGGGSNSGTRAYVRTQGGPLNVRSSPGGSIVGSLRNGSYITLSGRTSGSWVQLSNGNWVASSLISRSGGGGGSGGGSNPGTGAYVRTNGDSLNVRSSPGGSIVGSLRNGSYITLSGRTSGSWVQLSNGNWVASSLISRSGSGGGGGNPSGTLQQGSSGQAVNNLQNRLRSLGFYNGPITGYYGDLTVVAVRRFQSSRGIQVNGIAGPQTQAALYGNTYNYGTGGGGGGGSSGSGYSNASTNQTRYEAYVSTSGNALNIYSGPNGRVVGSIANGERLLLTGRRSGFWVQATDGIWLDEQYVRYSGRTF
jgi:hypothetical protein